MSPFEARAVVDQLSRMGPSAGQTGHGFAVFNSLRLGSVPGGPPGCVAIVTAWEPQHPSQTGMRLPARGNLAWG